MRRPSILKFALIGLAFTAFLLPLPGSRVERLYSSLFYPPLQRAMTTLSNLVPFALFDLLVVGFPVAWVIFLARDIMRTDRKLAASLKWLVRTVAVGAGLYLAFLG